MKLKLSTDDFADDFESKAEGRRFRVALTKSGIQRSRRLDRIFRGYREAHFLNMDPDIEPGFERFAMKKDRFGGSVWGPADCWDTVRFLMLQDFRQMGADGWIEKLQRIVADSAPIAMSEAGKKSKRGKALSPKK